MTLQEKFQALTPEQREKFYTIKDSAGLDGFLAETGAALSQEEKERVMELITSGKLPVADEELDNVAGGDNRPDDEMTPLEIIQAEAIKAQRDFLQKVFC